MVQTRVLAVTLISLAASGWNALFDAGYVIAPSLGHAIKPVVAAIQLYHHSLFNHAIGILACTDPKAVGSTDAGTCDGEYTSSPKLTAG